MSSDEMRQKSDAADDAKPWSAISPRWAADLSGLPPAHIHTAGFDPLRDEARAYADALERAGAKVRYVCHEQMIHNFYAMAGAIPYAERALKEVGADITLAVIRFAAAMVQNEPDMSEAKRQLQYAKEQLGLAGQYPRRKAATLHLVAGNAHQWLFKSAE
jgi:acetyl esterase/lipase